MNKVDILKKSKGLKSGSLTKDEYIELSNGFSIKKGDIRFIRNFKEQIIYFHQYLLLVGLVIRLWPYNWRNDHLLIFDMLVNNLNHVQDHSI